MALLSGSGWCVYSAGAGIAALPVVSVRNGRAYLILTSYFACQVHVSFVGTS